MSVDSYLELFTTLYGWLFYNVIWDVLVSTGVALLPFVGILLDNIIDSYQEYEPEDAARYALKGIEVEVVIAMIVITLAGNPFMTFQASEITYTPPSLLGSGPPHGTVSAADNSESTFATISFVGHPSSVDVPPWWYGVSQLSSGTNRAIMEGIPAILDYRNYMSEINTMTIEDPLLRSQVNDFYRDCFVPARSKYFSEQPTSGAITTLLNTHGEDDIDWIGSRVYLNMAGYYDTFRAGKLVEPFLYDPIRDVEWDVGVGDVPPTYGRPTCAQWWNGVVGVNGLKQQVIDEVSYYDGLMAIFETGFGAVDQRQDVMIKKILSLDEATGRFVPRSYDFAYSNKVGDDVMSHDIERGVKTVTTGIGSSVMAAFFGMFLDIFLRAAPMVQSLFLMGIVAFLPFLLIVSKYRMSVLMAGGMAWFSVKFWTVLWYMAFWVDQNLIIALFPDPGSLTLSTLFDPDTFNNRVILNFVTGMMYLMLPVLFTMIMSIAGFSAGRQLDAVKSMAVGKMDSGAKSVGGVAGKAGKFKK